MYEEEEGEEEQGMYGGRRRGMLSQQQQPQQRGGRLEIRRGMEMGTSGRGQQQQQQPSGRRSSMMGGASRRFGRFRFEPFEELETSTSEDEYELQEQRRPGGRGGSERGMRGGAIGLRGKMGSRNITGSRFRLEPFEELETSTSEEEQRMQRRRGRGDISGGRMGRRGGLEGGSGRATSGMQGRARREKAGQQQQIESSEVDEVERCEIACDLMVDRERDLFQVGSLLHVPHSTLLFLLSSSVDVC
jgi:hypothetical protein